mmetsp:Transcript_40108/g.78079  ORF Transcript_40108/g.78079 Transcript_40108/m.78079 type:complete len:84 (+) Transcript_40108:1589-1840(+)
MKVVVLTLKLILEEHCHRHRHRHRQHHPTSKSERYQSHWQMIQEYMILSKMLHLRKSGTLLDVSLTMDSILLWNDVSGRASAR